MKKQGVLLHDVLDIGAYVGDWTTCFKYIYPDADVLMVEANLECEKMLKKVGPYKMALLSDESGKEVEYHKLTTDQPLHHTGNSIYLEQSHVTKLFKPETRTTQLLSEVVPVKDYDLIKMDVQGSELDIIKGSLDLIKRSNYLLLETQVAEYNKGAPYIGEVISYLRDQGFHLEDLMELNYATDTDVLINVDVLFKKEKEKR